MKPFRSLTILLLLIVLLPVLFFSVYEITRINKNEKELLIIYNKQLEAILFSINLYSEDIVNSWATKINTNLLSNDTSSQSRFLRETPQLLSIAISSGNGSGIRIINASAKEDTSLIKRIENTIADSSLKIQRLATYYRGGYRKIEPLSIGNGQNSILSFFLAGEPDASHLIVMEIDPRRFITELLGQKIQATAENRMNIGIFENTTNRNIYRIGNFENHSEFQAEKQLWLFPQFNIGISLRDQDLASLSKQKNRAMLYLIIIVDLFFIASAFLVFRTIRKEVRLAQIKSDFISNVSHEIRTPLALISMYAETLEMNRLKSEDKKKEYYKVIFGESKRLSDIVNRILNFSKLESGKRTYNFSDFDLNELVEKIMLSYEYHLNIKGFAYQVELFQESILINGDFESLSDAFINLLDNSVKYSPGLKSINIRTGINGGFGYFEIADKGIGIAREHHKLIFDKFFRVAKGNTAYMAKGTGLGLTIVKNIVDAHQGKIEVNSKLNEGSVFRVLIPIYK